MNAAKSSLQASGARTCADDNLEFSLAHFSDPHLTSVTNVKIRELLNKRIFGYLSWLKRRRLEHRTEVLEALLRDLEHIRPNHTVITGDLTQLGLPVEFEQAVNELVIEACGHTVVEHAQKHVERRLEAVAVTGAAKRQM